MAAAHTVGGFPRPLARGRGARRAALASTMFRESLNVSTAIGPPYVTWSPFGSPLKLTATSPLTSDRSCGCSGAASEAGAALARTAAATARTVVLVMFPPLVGDRWSTTVFGPTNRREAVVSGERVLFAVNVRTRALCVMKVVSGSLIVVSSKSPLAPMNSEGVADVNRAIRHWLSPLAIEPLERARDFGAYPEIGAGRGKTLTVLDP
jgi:hypothetical protein